MTTIISFYVVMATLCFYGLIVKPYINLSLLCTPQNCLLMDDQLYLHEAINVLLFFEILEPILISFLKSPHISHFETNLKTSKLKCENGWH